VPCVNEQPLLAAALHDVMLDLLLKLVVADFFLGLCAVKVDERKGVILSLIYSQPRDELSVVIGCLKYRGGIFPCVLVFCLAHKLIEVDRFEPEPVLLQKLS
jgi:hypothetical protein